MKTRISMIAALFALSVTGGAAMAQSVNTEKGPISHPTANTQEKGTTGSEKGPVSHPTTADGSEKGPVSHPTAASTTGK
jgi:hypothetical protein